MPRNTHPCMNSPAHVRAARKFWGRPKHQAAAEDCARSRVDARAFLLEGLEGQSVASLPARAFGLNKTSRHFLRELNVFVPNILRVILCKQEMQINTTRNTPHAIARDSEALVLSLLGRLQQSLADTTRSPQQVLNELRKITLNQHELVRACVSAVRDVVSCKNIEVDPDVWKEFFDLAPERQHLQDRDPRRKLQALASLTAIWGM